MTNYDSRHTDFKNRFNNHLKKLTGQDRNFYSGMTQSDLFEFKSVFTDFNNILTFKATIEAANWISNLFKFDPTAQKATLDKLGSAKPNTKSFDIHIAEPSKIIAEVKCISPAKKGGKFSAEQLNSILSDVYKLKNGKKALNITSTFFKFLFLLDLGDKTDQAIAHLLNTSPETIKASWAINRQQIKQDIFLLSGTEKLTDLELGKVYLKKIKIDL